MHKSAFYVYLNGSMKILRCSNQILAMGILALMLGSPASADDLTQPGFNCGAATEPVEKFICENKKLSHRDGDLSRAYEKALDSLDSSEQRKELQREQQEWLMARAATCGLAPLPASIKPIDNSSASQCLADLYNRRIWQLQFVKIPDYLDFPARKYLFTPELLESKNEDVCNVFESGVQKYFKAQHPQNIADHATMGWGSLTPGIFKVKGGTWIGDTPGSLYVSHPGTPEAQSFFISRQGFIHGTFWTTLYTKPGETTREALEALANDNSPVEKELKNGGWNDAFGERTGDATPFHLLWIDDALYLYRDGSEEPHWKNYAKLPDNAVGLYRIESDGDLLPTCIVSAAPETAIKRPFSQRDENEDLSPTIETPHALDEFFGLLDKVAGQSVNSQPCQGTEGPYSWARYTIKKDYARYLALVQPWEVARAPSDVNRLIFLNEWAINSLYNYRIYEQIVDAMPKATSALVDFYIDNYGLDKASAKSVAKGVIDQIVNTALETYRRQTPETVASVESNNSEKAFRERYRAALAGKDGPSSQLIRKAVLMGMTDLISDTTEAQFNLAGVETTDDPTDATRVIDGEPIPFFAADNLKILPLVLEKGGDINAPNWFGKTVLMYAAQWNMPDVVEFLLAHDADVNSATPPIDKEDRFGCRGAPKITGRTALMYAAENAQASLIKMLLKAGADPEATNSEGDTAADLLESNPLLKTNEYTQIYDLLQQPSQARR